MNHQRSADTYPPRRRRWVRPAAAAGAGGAALVVWFEELILLATEFVGLIFLPVLAALIYLFNWLVFSSAMPRRMDPPDIKNKPRRW